MKEQLTQYVELLFAGAPGAEEIKQEILQNTLDRYDDLIDQGKSPEAAYRLAISGIGDIREILSGAQSGYTLAQVPDARSAIHEEVEDIQKQKMKAFAVALYILCAIPLIALSEQGQETLGLCLTLVMVASATVLIIMSKKHNPDDDDAEENVPETPKSKLNKSIDNLIGVLTLAIYLAVSFATGAWFITWLIFPISGCVKGIVTAILDLKEAVENEA